MKTKRFIFFTCLITLSCWSVADEYVDDIYYSDQAAAERQISSGDLQPYYDKNRMEPLLFEPVEPSDSLSMPADTLTIHP